MQLKSGFCALVLCMLSASARGQAKPQVPQVTVAAALTKQIHLAPNMTLRQLVLSLSGQMGVPIQLADYLADRRLTANLDHVTAGDALDALAELEDWQWKEDVPGRIRIERRGTLVPKEAAYIPRWMQAELPRDFRNYLNLSLPDDDPKKYYWTAVDGEYFNVSKSMQKINRLRVEQHRLIVEGHLPVLAAGEKVYFSAFTPGEKERLLLAMTMDAVFSSGPAFWRGDLPPYVMDPTTTVLQLHGSENLLIGTYMQAGGQNIEMGFGGNVKHGGTLP